MNTHTDDIIKRIKKRREELGLSYQDLAARTGLSKSTLQRYETGDIANIPLSKISVLAKGLQTTQQFIMGWEEETQSERPNIAYVIKDGIYNVPVYETVSAGFEAYACNEVIDYVPTVISNPYEAEDTIAIKVKGDSMYPKIEDGDIIVVRKQESVDSGSIAVVLLDGDEGLVKKVKYGSDWIDLVSINPEYKVKHFEGEEVERVRVVGLVRQIIKTV